ncbi:efflux RND transporter permease subunit [Pseudoalteromonas shioyasakiensis]|uniref:Efflux RND transporter permease subunit n=1 Tax=Pseudoalteromonas shioyasakiensis TaxID=1190813 RepID=A0ABT6TYE2_9GAMM|nr:MULTISPECIES: efflux RND transporter permease subunit [Pseudoalteromonas]MDI4653418.1 efflux RND transporter permease subunit [Pseudoalteromonas shioyasakiensis]MDI4668800.1 efflux RND transporter permease subunit [Pseudoalteromonas shioyasakiensis]MDI4673925.1 efflux RND transporter permease subunit [Pseudoalteromonas shioyasakiensis]MDI4685526.1 efflux RND transporter permease subunit [Pseudoalteromonas shioyasakiensis]MDI4704002.1 efflux RND transporter permease subunit [Pseudoalteromona
MSFAALAIERKVISWMFALFLLIGGTVAYFGLGQLEDPEFTLKKAMVITLYPGASPQQVEEEVTFPIENAIQQLPYVDYVTSISSPGKSQITVEMKSNYRKQDLRQIWDELRRKINDQASSMPSGVYPSKIMDDFGDVYGVMYAVTGDGYSYDELKDYVDYLKRELVLVDGVSKVTVGGEQQAQVMVEISTRKLAQLGISPNRIYQLLQTQNSVSNAGKVRVGDESIRLHPTGEFKDVKELENLLISKPGENELIYLGDVATVFREYAEVPNNIIRYNQQQALLVGVSFSTGVNVVDVGANIDAHLASLEYQRPHGMEINSVYNQPAEVEKSVSGFIISLLEAVAIVIIVLLVFMGFKSGVLIGVILLLTVLGTFIFMKLFAIDLQRISLGALIIALGMLVDNAIVVTEGILINLKRGQTKLQAATNIVNQTKWPLLGATVIAITAFAPIGLSSDASGEFAGSLFWVLFISLLLSWITAITLTPFFADLMFKQATEKQPHHDEDPYQGVIFNVYKGVLHTAMRYRKTTLLLMVILLVSSVYGFKFIKQSFFPASNTPMFYVDYWHTQGADIHTTMDGVAKLEKFLQADPLVEEITTTVGQGAPRFMLTYAPEKSYPAYGQLIIRVKDRDAVTTMIKKVRDYQHEHVLDAQLKVKRMEIGPSTDAKIEARFSGADPVVLRQLAKEAKDILHQDAGAFNIRDDWRARSKLIRPQFNEQKARRLGIAKSDLDQLLLTSLSGKQVGVYKDGTQMLPIIARSPAEERLNVESLRDLQIYSPVLGVFVPVTQVVDDFVVEWEDSLIMRRDRKRTITVMADHDVIGDETPAKLFARVRKDIEAIELPRGYELQWGGEYESSTDAQKAIFGSLPLGYLAMFAITVLLFNSVKKPLVIWATVPLAIVGVSAGLLLMNAAFSFMALLGLLSLSGMLIKNGIVLVDQINLELDSGKDPYKAVFDSGVSRVRPVAMAAITTILGMIPLLFDVFFQSMAVTIMFGLGFATVLTLIVVPVLYTMLFKIKVPKQRHAN